jgi:hypothetical protein
MNKPTMNTTTNNPVQFSKELCQLLSSELERVGADPAIIAINLNGYLGVVDDAESSYVCENAIANLGQLPDNFCDNGGDLVWEQVYQALGNPDFGAIDAELDEIYDNLGETGYWRQKGVGDLIFYREENADPQTLTSVPGAYARHYLKTTYGISASA